MSDSGCPDGEALLAFSIGRVAGGRWEAIAEHLDGCGECRERLEGFDGEEDGLVTELKRLPVCASAESERKEGGAGGTPTLRVVADAGWDLARRLGEGPVRLERFELQAELGVGSFGYVFRAFDPRLERVVALKVQRAGSFASPEEVQRFLREARSAAALKHPAIVSLYETGQTVEGVAFLVCEFIEGSTLEARLKQGPLEFVKATALAAELADALGYAHEHGVIHRDIKPSNVMLDVRGRPHLMDFGLAKQEGLVLVASAAQRTADALDDQEGEPHRGSEGESWGNPKGVGSLCQLPAKENGELFSGKDSRPRAEVMTSDGRLMGTPAYMSPEQARGAGAEIDARSDVYSLGVVLYEMLTGKKPFQGDRRETLRAVLEEEPRAPRQVRAGVPRDLEVICLKAMEKAAGRRYQTATELAGDLTRYSQGQAILARPMGPVERTWRWCRRYPLAVSVLAAVIVGSVAGLAYLSSLSEYFVQQTALASAELETKMLDEAWRFYSEEIEDVAKASNVPITENYKNVHPALPLPASFAIDLADRISSRSPGMEFRVYSRYPWPDRKDGGPQDELDVRALEDLETHARPTDEPAASYKQFVNEGGRRKLVYYSARHMEQSCLGCHNDPKSKSPKKDWVVGDVVGVLKIVRPLDREIASTQRGLRGAFVLMGATAGVLVVGSVVVVMVAGRKREFGI